MGDQPLSRIQAFKDYFATFENVVLAYLFGSHARGQAGPHSDVDVAVLLEEQLSSDARFNKRLQIITDLMDLLQTDKVDVVVLNEAPLALSYRVLRDGLLLHCASEDTRIMYTAETLTRYLDFEPILKRHERAVLERARQGELLHGYNPYRGALERYRQLRERLKGTTESNV
ncbi:MAG TPA: nucleotidyltransferase domain-containing protein [Anaerolineae bacterium]